MMKFFDYNLTTDISDIHFVGHSGQRPLVVDCLNPHSFVMAQSDSAFHHALTTCDVLLPDGIGVCMALKRWKGEKVNKIAGDDFHRQVIAEAASKNGRLFYLGSTPEVLQRIEQRLAAEHPSIRVMTWSPTFSQEMSDTENDALIGLIRSFAPNLLLIGLGAPKQEKWIERNRTRLSAIDTVAAIGGAFEFYAGTIRRASPLGIRLHLEWLVRFLHEPKRMWRRNMVSAPRFLRYTRRHRKEM